jgi:hypothetical protein
MIVDELVTLEEVGRMLGGISEKSVRRLLPLLV